MTSRIYWGEVSHWRREPDHSLRYPIFTFALDISPNAIRESYFPLFSRNGLAVFSITDSDYLGGQRSALLAKVFDILAIPAEGREKIRTTLVTMPRYFGYVFNPVSFFINQTLEGKVTSVLVEVHNTFGEAHLYPLRHGVACINQGAPTFHFDKSFFVSPFFDVSGDYELCVNRCDDSSLDISVILRKGGVTEFSARLSGTGESLTRKRLTKTLLRYPVTSLLTMPKIHLEALKLYKKDTSIFDKPAPRCPFTFHSKQGVLHNARLGLLRWLKSWRAADPHL